MIVAACSIGLGSKAAVTQRIARFKFRESVWRHYGKPGCLPQGLLPIGDAVSRFNPVYGQGMTVALQEAVVLREVLAEHSQRPAPLASLVEDFLVHAESVIATPWPVSSVPDFLYPQTRGERPANLEEQLQQQREEYRNAMHDPAVHRALLERLHLVLPKDVAKRNQTPAAAQSAAASAGSAAVGTRCA